MSEIKLDNKGRKYEYRKELANLVNQEVEITLFDIKNTYHFTSKCSFFNELLVPLL